MREEIEYWLKVYCREEPTEEFWNKANEYGIHKTFYAIVKAAQEDNCTMKHITEIIGHVVKEGNSYVYTRDIQRPTEHETLFFGQAIYNRATE